MSLEITPLKLNKNNPNLVQVQPASTSTILETSQPGIVKDSATVSSGSSSVNNTDDNLRSKTEVLNNVSLSVTSQEHQEMVLTRLREKINLRKREFELLVQGPEGAEEEKMDLERALKRFDKLIELPQSEIVKEYQVPFNMYTESLDNLLDCNARTLNLVLATTFVPSPSDLNYEVYVKEGIPKTYDDFLHKMAHHLPNWGFITGDFSPDLKNYFYLPGLPIVVQRTIRKDALLHLIVGWGAEVNEERLSRQEEEKIIEMANRIKSSKWLEHRSESLKQTESLTFVNKASFAGIASKAGHPIIQIDNSTTPLQLADRTIHEDYHHHLNVRTGDAEVGIYETENFQDAHCHKHSWTKSGRCTSLLNECFTYHIESDFRMLLLEEGELSIDEKIESIGILCNLRGEAKQAFEELHKNIERLNDDGQKWLHDAVQMWDVLGDRFGKYINENIDLLLGGKDFRARECGYKAIDNMCTHSPECKEEYYKKYADAIQHEYNCYVVLDEASKENRPVELQEVAKRRLADDDIFGDLYENLNKRLSEKGYASCSFTYDYLFKAWNACAEKRTKLSDLFIQSIKSETNADFLREILESNFIPDEFKTLVISRVENLSKI